MDGKKLRFIVGQSTSSKNRTSTAGQRAKGNDNTQRKKLLSSARQAAGASSDARKKEPATSSVQPAQPSNTPTDLQVMEKEYAEFEQKVRKTVYLDNLSHKVNKSVVKAALEQLGGVVKIDFVENYTIPFDIPQSALVEMETDKQAESVVTLMNEFPFMIAGMPRPVRARLAEASMFQDRPRKPGMNFDVRWTSHSDSDMKRIRAAIKVQEKERLALIKHQLEQEEELSKKQQETLDDYMKTYELVQGQSRTVRKLLRDYGINSDNV